MRGEAGKVRRGRGSHLSQRGLTTPPRRSRGNKYKRVRQQHWSPAATIQHKTGSTLVCPVHCTAVPTLSLPTQRVRVISLAVLSCYPYRLLQPACGVFSLHYSQHYCTVYPLLPSIPLCDMNSLTCPDNSVTKLSPAPLNSFKAFYESELSGNFG